MASPHRFGAPCGMVKRPNRIEEMREARGWKRPEMARRMNTSPQQVERLEKGWRKLTQEWMERASAVLDVQPADLLPGGSLAPPTNATVIPMEGASFERMHRDLPVYGTALGAPHDFDGEAIEQTTLNRAEIISYIKRPVMLNGRANAYGLYVVGESMSPVHPAGSTIVAERGRHPRVGDDVVVYLHGDDNGDDAVPRAVLVKRLVRRSGSFIELEQFTPALTFRIPIDQIWEIDRVYTLGDLLE